MSKLLYEPVFPQSMFLSIAIQVGRVVGNYGGGFSIPCKPARTSLRIPFIDPDLQLEVRDRYGRTSSSLLESHELMLKVMVRIVAAYFLLDLRQVT